MKVPILTIKNTLPEFFWLVNYLETSLSNQIWQLTTNASIAYEYKRILTAAALRTGAAVENVLFQGHDFSMRGMPGYVAASRSGSGHLASFGGTDTVGAVDYIEDYYGFGLDLDAYFIAGSIPATEHAVSSSNILTRAAKYPVGGVMTEESNRLLAEKDFLIDYITRQKPTGFCSYVADTYDYWKVLTEVLNDAKVKAAIMAREGRLVIRPDSGEPETIICGMKPVLWGDDKAYEFENTRHFYDFMDMKIVSHFEEYDCVKIGGKFYSFSVNEDVIDLGVDEIPYEVVAGSIRTLYKIFGGTVNAAGFKELDSHIGLIYGDSITLARADAITTRLEAMGFASTNVVFGIGSYTYQCNTRDTFGTAMKATGTGVEGDFFEIYKDPATGDKLKQSARGFLRVDLVDGDYVLTDKVTAEQEAGGELKVRFKDGKFFNLTNIAEVRARLV